MDLPSIPIILFPQRNSSVSFSVVSLQISHGLISLKIKCKKMKIKASLDQFTQKINKILKNI